MSNMANWQQATEELDAIVASFDEGDVTVDDLFEKLARATQIIEALEERLSATKTQVEELTPRLSNVASDE